MFRSTPLIIAALALYSNAISFPKPKGSEPDAPTPNLNPNRISPDRDPWKLPSDGLDALSNIPLPSQDDIELNMGNLEMSAQSTNTSATSPSVVQVDIVEIVHAILATPSCYRGSGLTTGGGGMRVASGTPCPSAPFTPTTTLPTSSFAACTAMADILTACQAADSFFYNGQQENQASCVCYSAISTTSPSCTGSPGAVSTYTTAQLDASAFDNVASSCSQYFSAQGYSQIAQGLSGMEGGQAVLGKGFCANVDQEMKSKGNASVGLSAELTTKVMCAPSQVASGAREMRVVLVSIGFSRGDVEMLMRAQVNMVLVVSTITGLLLS
jgi:hypothetical protein